MHLIENKGVKSECMKFGENSRQMPSVSTIFDEYYSYWPIFVSVPSNSPRSLCESFTRPSSLLVCKVANKLLGVLRYSGRGRGGRQPEVKCSILKLISIMTQRRLEVATVKT